MSIRTRIILAGVLLVVAFSTLILGQQFPLQVADDRGSQVTIENRPTHIVSIGSLYTEIVVDLNATAQLVAVASTPNNPSEVADLPKVGPSYSPNVEVIVSMSPDLVLGATDWGGERSALENAGIAVLTTSTIRTIPDILDTIRTVGTAIGKQTAATDMIGNIAEKLIRIETAVLGLPSVNAAFLYAGNPPYAAGTGAVENELIFRAGGNNVFVDVNGFPQVSVEQIVSRNPSVIFTDPSQISAIIGNPLLQSVAAIQNEQVYGVKASSVASTRVADTLQRMTNLLHPTDETSK